MGSFNLEIADDILDEARIPPDERESVIKRELAVQLYAREILPKAAARRLSGMEDDAAGGGIGAGSGGREDVLPGDARGSLGELQAQGVREVDLTPTGGQLGAVALGDEIELGAEGVAPGGWQKRGTIMVALATADHDLAAVEIDISSRRSAGGRGVEVGQARVACDRGSEADVRLAHREQWRRRRARPRRARRR